MKSRVLPLLVLVLAANPGCASGPARPMGAAGDDGSEGEGGGGGSGGGVTDGRGGAGGTGGGRATGGTGGAAPADARVLEGEGKGKGEDSGAPDRGREPDAPAVAAAALPGDPDAPVYFENQGNTKGWTVLGPAQHHGLGIADDPIAYRDSGGSVKSTCVYEAPNGERFHSEPRVDGVGVADGGDRYYGYALYLPPDWSYQGVERHVTAQFGAVFIKPNYFQHWVVGDKLQMGPIGGKSVTLGPISVGQWHTIVTHLRFGGAGQGMIEVWYDGRQVVSTPDTVPGGSDIKSGRGAFLWALGLYEAGWLSGNVGPQKTRAVYNAKIRVAGSAAAANPARW